MGIRTTGRTRWLDAARLVRMSWDDAVDGVDRETPGGHMPRAWQVARRLPLAGGKHAAGTTQWGFIRGARADALVLDTRSPGLVGIPVSHTLDALVFASNESAVHEVYVAGKQVVVNGKHPQEDQVAKRFADVMDSLWSRSPGS